ncbi:MAG TPA: arylsulfatase, partial [Armatimonadota bacterium]|nr:arylsulfatase [Armatimonadota bacterium]
RRGDMKLIEFFEDSHVELYDLAEDVGETRDLARERPDLAEELRQQLAEWRVSVGAQMPMVNPSYDPRRAHEWESYPPPWWE